MSNIRKGDKVVKNDNYYVSETEKGTVFTVRSDPFDICGTVCVLLEGVSGGYALDGLTKVDGVSKSERRYFAISIKHTEHGWKFGKPCILWGQKRSEDGEKRCFSGYTQYPGRAEVYSIQDFLDSGYGSIIKTDEPACMQVNLCKKWKQYDTVLIDKDEYIGYCRMCRLPLERSDEE